MESCHVCQTDISPSHCFCPCRSKICFECRSLMDFPFICPACNLDCFIPEVMEQNFTAWTATERPIIILSETEFQEKNERSISAWLQLWGLIPLSTKTHATYKTVLYGGTTSRGKMTLIYVEAKSPFPDFGEIELAVRPERSDFVTRERSDAIARPEHSDSVVRAEGRGAQAIVVLGVEEFRATKFVAAYNKNRKNLAQVVNVSTARKRMIEEIRMSNDLMEMLPY